MTVSADVPNTSDNRLFCITCEVIFDPTQNENCDCVHQEDCRRLVNGFVVEENNFDGYPCDKKYLVFHPIYDGAYRVYESDDLKDAIDWCNKQKFDEWTANLL